MDFNSMPSEETIQSTATAIRNRGIEVTVVDDRTQALDTVLDKIPQGAEVMNGSSTTLAEIGFVEYLKNHPEKYNNLHAAALSAGDAMERMELMRKAVAADYFLASVNAIAETGELFAADASGSRVGAFPFAAKKLILVSGVNKIVPTWNDAINRIRDFVYPLEDKRALAAYGAHSNVSKIVIIEAEMMKGRVSLVLIREKLGF